MANITTVVTTMTQMPGYVNTSDHLHTETELPFEAHTGNLSNNSRPQIRDDGFLMSPEHYPPLVWKIPHLEDLFLYGIGTCMFFGTFGNIVSFMVLFRKRMRQLPVAPYLCSLAIVDTLALWNVNQDEWFNKVFGRAVIENIPCNVRYWVLYAISLWSTWLTVFLTGERCIVIKFPFKTASWRRPSWKRNVVVVILPILFFLVTCSTMFAFNDSTGVCVVLSNFETALLSMDYFYFISKFIVPTLLLFVLNSLIIHEVLFKSKKDVLGQLCKRKRENRRLAILAVVVSVTFMVLTLPLGIFVMASTGEGQWFINEDNKDMYIVSVEDMYLILLVLELLNYNNHSINFLLYMVTSPRFREEILQLIPKGKKSQATTNIAIANISNRFGQDNRI